MVKFVFICHVLPFLDQGGQELGQGGRMLALGCRQGRVRWLRLHRDRVKRLILLSLRRSTGSESNTVDSPDGHPSVSRHGDGVTADGRDTVGQGPALVTTHQGDGL